MPCGMVQVCGGAHVVGGGVAIAVMGGVVQIILKSEVGDGAVGVHEVVVAGVDFADGLKGLRVGV